jgi:hypothetical protein
MFTYLKNIFDIKKSLIFTIMITYQKSITFYYIFTKKSHLLLYYSIFYDYYCLNYCAEIIQNYFTTNFDFLLLILLYKLDRCSLVLTIKIYITDGKYVYILVLLSLNFIRINNSKQYINLANLDFFYDILLEADC